MEQPTLVERVQLLESGLDTVNKILEKLYKQYCNSIKEKLFPLNEYEETEVDLFEEKPLIITPNNNGTSTISGGEPGKTYSFRL